MKPIGFQVRAPRRLAALWAAAAEMRARPRVNPALLERDAEVRAHEHAHVAALGNGVIHYDTVVGPDGNAYAVGGGVSVDLSPVPGDPEATVRKAKAAIQAAYAVGEPSAADMKVAAEAYQMEMAAQREIQRRQETGRQAWFA